MIGLPDAGVQRPTVVVTRPAAQAAAWVQRLQAAGWPVLALPLIDIGPAPDPVAVRQALADGSSWDAVMFVSPAAVRAVHVAGIVPPSGQTRCWAPGDGTVRALRDWGVPAAAIDAPPPDAPQMDSEALWAVVEPQVQPGRRLLIIRGVSPNGHAGRDWLADRCRHAGADVVAITAYRRQPPCWNDAERAAARAAVGPGAVWLFSSSEAIGHARDLLPDAPWHQTIALATHPRIADAARALGIGRVVASRPSWADVLQALESLV